VIPFTIGMIHGRFIQNLSCTRRLYHDRIFEISIPMDQIEYTAMSRQSHPRAFEQKVLRSQSQQGRGRALTDFSRDFSSDFVIQADKYVGEDSPLQCKSYNVHFIDAEIFRDLRMRTLKDSMKSRGFLSVE
jgi:hypothetical protein